MLNYSTDKKHFIIEEIEFKGTYTKTNQKIYYTKDLEYKKVNCDPWRKTTKEDKEWFNKHYRHKFKEEKI